MSLANAKQQNVVVLAVMWCSQGQGMKEICVGNIEGVSNLGEEVVHQGLAHVRLNNIQENFPLLQPDSIHEYRQEYETQRAGRECAMTQEPGL